MQQVKFTTETVRKSWIVRVRGSIVMANAAEFRTKVLAAASAKGPAIMLDLEQVDEMDSAGVAVLAELHRLVKSQGRPLVLVGTSEAVTKIVNVLRAAHVVCDVCRTISEGIRNTQRIHPGQEAGK